MNRLPIRLRRTKKLNGHVRSSRDVRVSHFDRDLRRDCVACAIKRYGPETIQAWSKEVKYITQNDRPIVGRIACQGNRVQWKGKENNSSGAILSGPRVANAGFP